MNGQDLEYDVTTVSDSLYYQDNAIKKEELKFDEINTSDFFYVYHFNAVFAKGVNHIFHRYKMRLSYGVSAYDELKYILTAASRWKGGIIKEFELIIDFPSLSGHMIDATFFNSDSLWKGGVFRMVKDVPYSNLEILAIYAKSPIYFSKKDFHPIGDISLYHLRDWIYLTEKRQLFDAQKIKHIPFHDLSKVQYYLDSIPNQFSYKVIRNLPFARRGYIFKDPLINSYYSNQSWYHPDHAYRASLVSLTIEETEWIMWLDKLYSKKW